MLKKDTLMPAVRLERLPLAVIDALEGPIVKQNFLALQSLPALNMATVAMMLRRKISACKQTPEVVLERLPEHLMTALARTNGRSMLPLSEIAIIKQMATLEPSELSNEIKPNEIDSKGNHSLEVTLEHLPRNKAMMKKQKRRIGQLRKI
ncbi:uncharacterized protein [Battus philenor]|uniref:uncharacterized protein n=1 Tax=Battus philenor TaxID=42288 RepID=UPI0035D0BDDE